MKIKKEDESSKVTETWFKQEQDFDVELEKKKAEKIKALEEELAKIKDEFDKREDYQENEWIKEKLKVEIEKHYIDL